MPREYARTTLVTLILFTIVGAGLASGLGLLGRWAWWLDLFAHFQLQCAAALLLALLLALLARRRRLALAAGVLLAVHLALLAPYAVPGDRSFVGPPLRLAHLNLLTSNDRHAEVVAWVASSGADVVLLQEVDARWAAVLAATPGYRPIELVPRADNFGLAALARVDTSLELVASERRDFAGLPALALQLRHHERALALLSLHTLPPISAGHAATRDAQLVAAGAWASGQIAGGAAPIVLGDLNATPFSAGVAPLRAAGLRDSLLAGGLLAAGSWPDLPWPLRIAIDHGWHDPRLVTVSRHIGPALGSDHRPLTLELAWAAAP